jgi:MYXO-CTERM domain-containing protein
VLELALAYNFVTPYTAFLAVPESELGAMKSTVDNARAAKQKILAENPDAAGLKNVDKADMSSLAQAQAAPVMNAPMPTQSFRGAVDDEDADAPMAKRDVADRDSDGESESFDEGPRGQGAPINATTEVKHHGCAGCATTGSDAGVFVLVFVGLVLRRRRR